MLFIRVIEGYKKEYGHRRVQAKSEVPAYSVGFSLFELQNTIPSVRTPKSSPKTSMKIILKLLVGYWAIFSLPTGKPAPQHVSGGQTENSQKWWTLGLTH